MPNSEVEEKTVYHSSAQYKIKYINKHLVSKHYKQINKFLSKYHKGISYQTAYEKIQNSKAYQKAQANNQNTGNNENSNNGNNGSDDDAVDAEFTENK